MHLAILMTNTDESSFAQAHPKDGEKFSDLVHMARPDWRLSVFSVKDGVFPDDITTFDGVLITGSPASVHDPAPWVAQLLDVIRTAYAANVPMFGACFGHQAIALALGGTVEDNPGGWVFGLTEAQVVDPAPWMAALGDTLLQYGAHTEQVTTLPPDARVLTASAPCPIAGFAIENRVYCTQNHPEMDESFVAALTEEYADTLGPEVAKQARASLTRKADTRAYAETVAQFFEQAVN